MNPGTEAKNRLSSDTIYAVLRSYRARYAVFQMAEAALPRSVFQGIVNLFNGLRGPPAYLIGCMMDAAPGKRRESVEAGHSKAQHALILTFFSKVGGSTRSEPVDTDLTGPTSNDTRLMNRIPSYTLTEASQMGNAGSKGGSV